jgi:hypothetical protein
MIMREFSRHLLQTPPRFSRETNTAASAHCEAKAYLQHLCQSMEYRRPEGMESFLEPGPNLNPFSSILISDSGANHSRVRGVKGRKYSNITIRQNLTTSATEQL